MRCGATALLTWLIWFAAFVALEKSLCRRYPGIRTLCRMLFLGTVAIAIVPGVWTLAATRFHGPFLLAAVTHAFSLGVLAQTSVRMLFLGTVAIAIVPGVWTLAA